jgi:hypothetical protein
MNPPCTKSTKEYKKWGEKERMSIWLWAAVSQVPCLTFSLPTAPFLAGYIYFIFFTSFLIDMQ